MLCFEKKVLRFVDWYLKQRNTSIACLDIMVSSHSTSSSSGIPGNGETGDHEVLSDDGYIVPPPLVYDASESDTTRSDIEPRRQRVAKEQGTQKVSQNVIRLRTERWHKRRRDQGEDHSEPSHNTLDPAINLQASYDSEESFSISSDMDIHSLEKHLTTMKESERLRHMRRPSTIVPDIRMGSRLEAGMTPENQEAFKRLVLATSFRMQSLDRKGHAQPMPKGQRSFYGLEHYSPRLVPPPTERFVRPVRVPRILLSVHYRGTGLKRRYSRNWKTKHRSQDLFIQDKAQSGQGGSAQGEKAVRSLSSEPSDYIADFDYWCPTSEYEEAERARVLKRAKEYAEAAEAAERIAKEAAMAEVDKSELGPTTEKSKSVSCYTGDYHSEGVQFSKEDFVRQILESESDKEDSSGDRSAKSDSEQSHVNGVSRESIPPGVETTSGEPKVSAPTIPAVYPYIPAPEHLEERQRKERIDEEIVEESEDEDTKPHPLFDNLMSSVLKNPDSVLRVPDMKQGVPLTIESGALNPAASHDEPYENEDNEQENLELSGYELEKSLAKAFCGRRPGPISRVQTSSHKRKNRKRKRDKSPIPSSEITKRKDDTNGKEQLNVLSQGWYIMRRYGFSSRLGRTENGIAGPLEHRRRIRGAGVGKYPETATPSTMQADHCARDSDKSSPMSSSSP